jgi:hypothetical protein
MGTKSKSIALVLVALFLTSLVTVASATSADTAPIWNIQVIDPLGNNGKIMLDTNGNPQVVYRIGYTWNSAFLTDSNWTIKPLEYTTYPNTTDYLAWTGNNWTVRSLNLGIFWIDYVVVLDSMGNPHVIYRYENVVNNTQVSREERYAYWTGLTWKVQTIDSADYVFWWPSFVLDSNNNPHVAFYDDNNDLLKYATYIDNSWKMYTIDETDNAQSAIAIDSKGYPYVAYGKGTSLEYASWNDNGWNIQTIDSSNYSGGTGISLFLDSKDQAHVSYISELGQMYAEQTNKKWVIELVDPMGYGLSNSLALDTNGNPHIVYDKFVGTTRGAPIWGNLTYASLKNPSSISSQDSMLTALTVAATAVTILILVAIISSLIYRRHRKAISQNKPNA